MPMFPFGELFGPQHILHNQVDNHPLENIDTSLEMDDA